jgi:serine protease Do
MSALAAAVFFAHAASLAPASLAGKVPAMTAPVVHIRSVKHVRLSSLPWISRLGHQQMSVGSGFVVDKRGLILTNEHLVAGADRVIVTVDADELHAEVVGRDQALDVALLEVRPRRPLPVAHLGHSTGVRVGDPVVAVGNPFGLDHTVTSGIISARLRTIERESAVPLIQTDASINPGNSGGPLYDLDGRVIGINTAIIQNANGISFAVPVDFIRLALPQLRHGKVERGFLGARLDQVTPRLRSALGLGRHLQGALVAAVVPGGPAETAGLRPGDVIVRWDGQSMDSAALPPSIALSPPGRRVKVRLLRAGTAHELLVEMGRPLGFAPSGDPDPER